MKVFFALLELPNSMVRFLPESMNLPNIFHSMEMYIQLPWKIKFHSISNKDPDNFYTMDCPLFRIDQK